MDSTLGTSPFARLSVSGFSKKYGRIAALENVSFSVRPGEILGLIGPNGAGKTTLFECMSGLTPPASGVLLRDDRPMSSAERGRLIFYLPDAIAPWADQPLGWVLNFGVHVFGGSPAVLRDVVDRLELSALVKTPVGALSKGQRKRALLAFGLNTPQPILLVDEPFEGLDLRQTREVAHLLRHYASTGRTLVLSIHQISDAAKICDRFVLLSAGVVCAEGTREELSAYAGQRGLTGPSDFEEVFLALT
jgi:ABC-2 type transport system ATP-binding protein